MAATAITLVQQLVMLLIQKRVLEPQEMLDAFARVPDDIQCSQLTIFGRDATALPVRLVENFCRHIAKATGAQRKSE